MTCMFYTSGDVMRIFGISRTTLSRWLSEGIPTSKGEKLKLPSPAIKGTPHRFRTKQIDDFLEKLSSEI